MSNPIKYSELIDSDVRTGLNELATSLGKANAGLEKLMKTARDNQTALKKALGDANPATLAGQDTILKMAKEIDDLNRKIKSLEEALKNYKQTQKEIASLDRETIRAKQEHKEAVLQLNKAVRAGLMDERDEAEIMRKANDETERQTLSMNELAFAYRRMEQEYRNMSRARESDKTAMDKLAVTMKAIYEQENLLNQAIGKHQMSVGNYAKSWNGLNIAFQQIIRETPNMAMGFNTFFLAISNNIPILTDQIKLAQDKYKADMEQIKALQQLGGHEKEIADIRKSAVPVGKQILSSLFSWQTLMLAGVTLLTMFGGKLIENLSAWIKSRKGIDENVESLKAYNKALRETSMSGAEASEKLRVLYREATDLNASMEDRLGAIKDLKALYPDIFNGLETEAILAGKARVQYELLAESTYKAAMAEAAFSKLSKVASDEIEAKMKKRELDEKAFAEGYLGIVDMASYKNAYTVDVNNPESSGGSILNGKQRSMVKEYEQVAKTLHETERSRQAIIKMMEDNDLFGFLKGNKSGGGRGSSDKVGDLYWTAMESIIGGMEEGSTKALATIEMNYGRLIEEYQAKEKELQALAKSSDSSIKADAEEQLKNLSVLMASARVNYEKEKQDFISDILKDNTESVATEEDYDEIALKAFETRLKAEKALWDANAYALFQATEITQDELNKKLADNNTKFWQSYINWMKSPEGVFDVEKYNEASSHLLSSGTSGSKSQRYKKRSWTSRLLGKSLGVELNPNSSDYDQNQVNEFELYEQNLRKVMGKAVDYINDVISAYIDLKKQAVETAQAQVDAANTVYEAELGAYENGYANNVEYARKELALRKEQLAQAEKEQKRAKQIQLAISSATQAASLAESVANLFASGTKMGLIGIPIAMAATATLLASFASAKKMASKASQVTYGEGMHEYLDYGGSHASGNDIDFGVGKDGRRRRVEKGEMIAVFNKRNTDRYGAGNLADLVDSINRGTFETDYLGIFNGGQGGKGVVIMNQFPSSVSDDISAIRKSTESQRYSAGNGTIVEKYRNRTRIIHIS